MELRNLKTWQSNLGVLPIRLNRTQNRDKFIMLDGGFYDFCLDINEKAATQDSYYSDSWSTSTKTFVYIGSGNVSLFNWYKNNNENYKIDSVTNNFEAFVRYINSSCFKTEDDMIPFVLNLFRQLRNITQEKVNPVNALSLFFKLLISINEDFNTIDCNLWKIEDVPTPPMFDNYVQQMQNGVHEIKPNLDLILRHCAGPLFQEAQRTATFFDQDRDLFGIASSNIGLQEDLYTSIHYTPQYLARSIVENVLRKINLKDKLEIKIFDPACGSGVFLIEALNQIQESDYNGNITIIGWDSSESAINTATFLLDYEKRTQWSNNKMKYELKVVRDSLQEKWMTDNDIIVMNPPFISWDLLSNQDEKEALLQSLIDIKIKGKPNQAIGFFYKAIRSLKKDGVIGSILPSSFLNSSQYFSLRDEIQSFMSIECIAHLGNYIFKEALTDVCFVIALKMNPVQNPLTIWCKNEKGIAYNALKEWRKMNNSHTPFIDNKKYSIYRPIEFPIIPDTWNIISKKEEDYYQQLREWTNNGRLVSVENIFVIHQGVITGKRDLFEISSVEYDQLPIEEKKYFRPLAWKNSIKNGHIQTSHYLWYPYDNKGLMIQNEQDALKISFVSENLKPFKKELKERRSIESWWGLTRPRKWQYKKGFNLYSSRFGDNTSFGLVRNKKDNFVSEEGNVYILRNNNSEKDYFFYLTCFCSKAFRTMMPIFTKHLQKGYDLAPGQVKKMLLPIITDELREMKAFKNLVLLGKMLSDGEEYIMDSVDNYLNGIFYPKYDYDK